jgi:hypothetical protein
MANPFFAGLITDAIGDGLVTDMDQLRKLILLADDPGFEGCSGKPSGRQGPLCRVIRPTRTDCVESYWRLPNLPWRQGFKGQAGQVALTGLIRSGRFPASLLK